MQPSANTNSAAFGPGGFCSWLCGGVGRVLFVLLSNGFAGWQGFDSPFKYTMSRCYCQMTPPPDDVQAGENSVVWRGMDRAPVGLGRASPASAWSLALPACSQHLGPGPGI